MFSTKTVFVDFASGSTNAVHVVSQRSGDDAFYDTVKSIHCYANGTEIGTWTGSTDSRLELSQSGTVFANLTAGKPVNYWPDYSDLDYHFEGSLNLRWFHNQNAFALPTVKNCSVTLAPSNWFAEIVYSDAFNSLSYCFMVLLFVGFGAWVGKRIAQGRKARKNNRG